jgi:dynein heavy chain
MRKFFKNIVPNVVISQVGAICKLLEVILKEQEVKGLEFIFVFCTIWCMGAGLEIIEGNKSRINFDKFWRDMWKTIKFPTKGTVFDYFVDIENSKLEDWNKMSTSDIVSSIDTSKSISSYTIPTVDIISASYLMRQFVQINHCPILVGLAGCGKTQIIKGLLNELTGGVNSDYLQ